MKRVLGLLMAFMLVLHVVTAEAISEETASIEIAPLEEAGQMILLPENMLAGDFVNCFEILPSARMFLSEGNRFAIVDSDGQCLYADALHHPKLKGTGEEIRGVYGSGNTLLLAVYDYSSDRSYVAIVDVAQGTKKYMSLLNGCIKDAVGTENGLLIAGEKGKKKRQLWAAIVSDSGEVLWQYQNQEAADSKTNLTHRVALCGAKTGTVYLLMERLDKIGNAYGKQYQLQVMSSDLQVIRTMDLGQGALITTPLQMLIVDNMAYIRCAAYDGEQDFIMLIEMDVTDGTQHVDFFPSKEKQLRTIAVSEDGFVSCFASDEVDRIQKWKNGELEKEFCIKTSSGEDTISIDQMLVNGDSLWCLGTVNRYENNDRLRTVCLIRLE